MAPVCAADLAVEGAPLDLHEGIDDPRHGGCLRWPEKLWLLNRSTGELVPGRCRATNLCPYCARLYAVETSEMLLLDAMEDAPTLYVVLTARELLDKKDCRRHLYQLRKALRRRWPDVRWAVLAEFQKRGALHLNLLTKGVPAADLDEYLDAIAALWCARVDAERPGQWADAIADGIGVVKYVTLHFMKPGQSPPIGWRGHRYSSTRDYLVRPAAVMRLEARRALRLKRKLHAGIELQAAELELAIEETADWSLVGGSGGDPDRERSRAARAPFNTLPRVLRVHPAKGSPESEPNAPVEREAVPGLPRGGLTPAARGVDSGMQALGGRVS